MEEIISKKEFDEIMKVKGEVRGVTFKGYRDYILKEEGKEGLKKFEEAVAEFGYPKEIRTMDFYPLGFQILALEAMKNIFKYDNEKFREIGRFSAKVSMIVRLFSKHFFSIEQMIKHSPEMWRRYYTVGKVELGDYKEEERRLIIRLKNFAIHPLHGQVLVGYFASLLQMIGGEKVKGEEVKSPFRGDDCYEFLMTW